MTITGQVTGTAGLVDVKIEEVNHGIIPEDPRGTRNPCRALYQRGLNGSATVERTSSGIVFLKHRSGACNGNA